MNFAEIVRSSTEVRGAFDGVAAWRSWWRLILMLHGKPVAPGISDIERRDVLARGFRFYGQLYCGLGILLAGLVGLVLGLHVAPDAYWLVLALLAGAYLVQASRLAFAGARLFRQRDRRGPVLLMAFFVVITLFLGAFATCVSVSAQQGGVLVGLPNLAAFASFWLLGVGSYGLEMAYLLHETSSYTQA